MSSWRLIAGAGADDSLRAARGARNMAVDHALLESVQAGGSPVLRLYCWNPVCLSLGRNQHATAVFDRARARSLGIDVVRRPTGGLAVLHDRELTYCVLAPTRLLGGPRTAYQVINQAVMLALRDVGVPAATAPATVSRSPRADAAEPCFAAPAAGEIVAGGRKLVGSAQRCERGALLQHGSILLDGTQSDVRALLGDSTAPDLAPAVTLASLLGAPPPVDLLAARLRRAFEDTFGTRLAPDTLAPGENDRAATLEAHYAGAAWTWRR